MPSAPSEKALWQWSKTKQNEEIVKVLRGKGNETVTGMSAMTGQARQNQLLTTFSTVSGRSAKTRALDNKSTPVHEL